MNPSQARYALLVAADALQDDPARLEAHVADDGAQAAMTATQVVDALRAYASLLSRPPAPEPSKRERREIDRFGIFAEEAGR